MAGELIISPVPYLFQWPLNGRRHCAASGDAGTPAVPAVVSMASERPKALRRELLSRVDAKERVLVFQWPLNGRRHCAMMKTAYYQINGLTFQWPLNGRRHCAERGKDGGKGGGRGGFQWPLNGRRHCALSPT